MTRLVLILLALSMVFSVCMVSLAETGPVEEEVRQRQPYIFEEGMGEKTGFSLAYSKDLEEPYHKQILERYEGFFSLMRMEILYSIPLVTSRQNKTGPGKSKTIITVGSK